MAGEDDDVVFRALADATRRSLLDALFERDGRTVTELAAVAPALTRFTVMKHLTVLEHAGLVTTERVGRSKHHFLNPVPIQRLADRWIGKFARPFTHALVDLDDHFRQELPS
jgi:DNA-binding transcriptional ArsR family regulator